MTIWKTHVKNICSARRASILALATLAICAGCKGGSNEPSDIPVAVQAEHPHVGPISEEIAADAVLAPMSEAALSPRISAPIRAEYVQRGAHVHRGELLLVLDDRDLQGAALDTKGALATAEAAFATTTQATIPADLQRANLDLATAKINLEVASQTAADRRKLFAQGALPGRDADIAAAAAVQAQATYDTAKKRLDAVLATTQASDAKAAQGQLTAARGRFMNAQAQVSYATFRSPIDGIVTDRPLFPGETAPAGTPVITIMDTSSLIAKLHITQADVQQLRLGDKADVFVSGIEQPVEAAVSLISPALDPGSTTVEVWLKLANADGRLKAGTAVHARIRGTTIQNAITIPIGALLPAQGGSNAVMIVGPDHVAHQRSVTVGIRTPETAQILKGLSPLDNLIVEGSYGLDDGTKVTLESTKPDKEDTN
ncbi:MAG: efflux RND transporter periplasmic adaptor subunit [Acidobacteria bacterium]|nr:efflux RND transporter periplasmic adaptor subunit [Acidobacteriota bacterium]